jgi:hypothetical protein
MPHSDPDPSACAVRTHDGRIIRHSELASGFALPHSGGARVHVPADQGLEAALANALGAWQQGGSVVMTHPDVALTDKLLADERIHGS